MKTVWKFPLAPICSIEMPMGSKLLSVHVQQDIMCLWALVDPSIQETEDREFIIYGTGHPIEDISDKELEFVGTVQFPDVELVLHVFEKINNHHIVN